MVDGLQDGPAQLRSRLRRQITYGNALRLKRGFGVPETRAAFAAARELAGLVGDVAERFAAHHGLWIVSFIRGDLAPMQDATAALLRDAERASNSQEAAK
jgi:hypothetical protein